MSTCEKCWVDACRNVNLNDVLDISDEYHRLLKERKDNPCTPEEQAGPEAKECPACSKKTCHQYTGECMCCGFQLANKPGH
jgi:hypothetical protein